MRSLNPLSLAHVQTFAYLAGDLHFTRTAEALNLTQPAVSQHVKALEEHFKVKLIDRGREGRRPTLTAAGCFLAERAEALMDGVAAIEREMLEFSQLRVGRLRLGVTLTIGNYGVARFLQAFRRLHPDIEIDVLVENTERIAERVRRGEISVGLIEGAINKDGLEETPYADDELMLIAPPGHRLAKMRRAVTASDLAAEGFVMRESGSGTRALFEAAMVAAGVPVQTTLALPSSEGILQAVEAGLGLAVLSSVISEAAVRDGRLRRRAIADLCLQRTFRLIRLAHVTPSPATLAFSAIVLNKHVRF